mmetsp:Transcript_69171/g.101387  ORF Transcript_69171/g.101387 Transcript_69171/m.101387 type:complete len:736 (-) Transcript_69171:109-2316(-)
MLDMAQTAERLSRRKHLAAAVGFAATVAAVTVIGCIMVVSGDGARTALMQQADPAKMLPIYPVSNAPMGVQKGRVAASFFPPSVVRQMDLNEDPCHDFYQYACGGFEKKVEIPEDLGGFARSWDGGSAKIYAEMRKILESDKGKAGDWFRSCMMIDKVNEMGAEPVTPYLKQIESIETYDDLWAVMSQFQFWDVPAFFDWWVGADNLKPELMNMYFGTGGLILPDYTFYTEGTDEMKSHRGAYREFIVSQLKLTGLSDKEANRDADVCMEIETELAVYQRLEPYVSLKESFVHLSHDEFIQQNPNINFEMLFKVMGIDKVGVGRKNIVVKAPEFFHKLNDFFGKRSAKSLIPYLRWHLTYNLSPLLGHEFLEATLKVDANLMGISKQPERWHKCVAATKSALPTTTEQLFISHFFSEDDRQVALTMLDFIRDAFKKDLESVAWMTEESRTAAQEKLHNIFFECGHPMTWEPDNWPVSADSYFNNSLASCEAKKKRKLARLFEPRNRRRWSMSIMSVNSYYDNAVNGLFITAGMLQKPFFNSAYDMARNFGGVGAIMGHELTHGFDNTGRKYDQDSRLRDWWDKQTIDEYESRASCIAELYNGFEMLGLHIKGNLTLGENIADFGGIKAAYNAYINWFTHHYCKGISESDMPMTWQLCQKKSKPRHYQKQLFWVSYGQNWCDKERDPSIRMAILTDEHSPDKFRVNGPLSQNLDFQSDWECPANSKMNPPNKCALW